MSSANGTFLAESKKLQKGRGDTRMLNIGALASQNGLQYRICNVKDTCSHNQGL
jgi:hypothetical protein